MDENIFICDGDIEIKYTLKVNGLIPLVGSVPFYLRYYNPNDETNYVEASFDGVIYKNITPEGDHYIIAIKDVHFAPGRMFCWERIEVASTYFSNGKRADSSRYDVGAIVREVDSTDNVNSQVNFTQGIWFDFPTRYVVTRPDVGESNVIYFVPSGAITNMFLYSENAWNLVGTTNVDLTSYYNKIEIDNILKGFVKVATGSRLLTDGEANKITNAIDATALTEAIRNFVVASPGERLITETEANKITNAIDATALTEAIRNFVVASPGERLITETEVNKITNAIDTTALTKAFTDYSETKELTTMQSISLDDLQVFKVRDETKNVELRLPISVLLNAAKAANLQSENPLFGEQDGKHSIYTCNSAFVLGTTSVWINGKKYFRGRQYIEMDDKTIQLTNYLPEPTDTLYIEGYWQ